MERLIYTNSLPSKLHLKTFPRLPKLHFSSLLHVEPRRPNSLSCKCIHQFSSSGSIASSRFGDGHAGNSSESKHLQDGSGSKPHLLNWVAEILSQQRKVFAFESLYSFGHVFVWSGFNLVFNKKFVQCILDKIELLV